MKIAIIGAGLAGLTAAYELRGTDAKVDVYEATDRVGGKLHTVAFEAGPTDMGAEAFLARRQDAVDFFTELGLADSLVEPSGLRSLVWVDGEARALPTGGVMGIPASSEPVRHLVSDETAERIDAEASREGFAWDIGGDVNVGQLVRERYGDEVVDTIVSSLLGGVYSCTADDLGVRATVPQLAGELDRLGLDVLLDDRTSSPGVKFKDAELLGVPWIVVVGRGWADGTVELRNRFTGEKTEVPVDGAATAVTAALAG